VASGGEAERFEIYVALLKRWFAVSVFSPKTEQFVAIVDDITESKTAELLVRQSEAMQRAILDSVNSHIAVLDSQGIILAVNRPWMLFAEENGIYPQMASNNYHVGENYLDVCQRSTGDSSEGALTAVNGIKAVLNGRIVNFNMEYPCHSPMQQRWFGMAATPLGEAKRGVVIAHTNITERKLAENAVNLLRDDLSATLQAIPDLLFEIDEAGRYIAIRTTQEDLLVAPAENLVESTVQQILPADAAQTVLQAMAAAKVAGADYGRTIWLPLPEGERCFELSVARKTNNNNKLCHFVVLSRDITKRIATEAALLQQTRELAERNAELQRFNRAMVGRELAMIELKKEVNALSQQLGSKPPYSLDFLDAVPQFPPPTSPS
jgi:PAS domain-containing protein